MKIVWSVSLCSPSNIAYKTPSLQKTCFPVSLSVSWNEDFTLLESLVSAHSLALGLLVSTHSHAPEPLLSAHSWVLESLDSSHSLTHIHVSRLRRIDACTLIRECAVLCRNMRIHPSCILGIFSHILSSVPFMYAIVSSRMQMVIHTHTHTLFDLYYAGVCFLLCRS